MSKQHELHELQQVVTDPNKLRYASGLSEEMLGLIVSSFVSESGWEILRQNEAAYNLRGIYRLKAIDHNSPQAKQLAKERRDFERSAQFTPYPNLLNKTDLLKKARVETIYSHPYSLSQIQAHYGVEVIGARPDKSSGVDLLLAHDQVFHESGSSFTLESEKYHIPKQLKMGSLKLNPDSSIPYFSMPRLSYHDNTPFIDVYFNDRPYPNVMQELTKYVIEILEKKGR